MYMCVAAYTPQLTDGGGSKDNLWEVSSLCPPCVLKLGSSGLWAAGTLTSWAVSMAPIVWSLEIQRIQQRMGMATYYCSYVPDEKLRCIQMAYSALGHSL